MIRQFLRFSFLTIIIAGLSGGCAVGQKYHYDNVIGDLYVSGNKTIGVVTQDKRPYILSGKKTINFVGIMRGGYGNPFNVVTESGQPLVDDMTQSICLSLSKRALNQYLSMLSLMIVSKVYWKNLRQLKLRILFY